MQHRRGHALAFLDKYEPKGRKKEPEVKRASADTANTLPGFVSSKPPEILPPTKPSTTSLATIPAPAPLALPLPPRPADVAPQLDAMVRRLNDLLHNAMKTFDLDEPEGFLDTRVFERPDHRLSVKIARSGRALELLDNFSKTLEAAERADEKIRSLNRTQQQEYVEQLRLARTALEEYYGVQHAPAAAQRREQIDAAKAEALIETYKAQAAKARLSALPPPPQVILPLQDAAEHRREEARRKRWEMLDLDLDEAEDRASAGEEKLARAKARCIAIYKVETMREGEKRARIQKLLDEFGFDCSILPAAIEDLMIRGYEEVSQ